jgi:hypothetical protein
LSVNFGTTVFEDIDVNQLKDKLQPKSILPRIAYRKQLGNALSGKKDIIVHKGMVH